MSASLQSLPRLLSNLQVNVLTAFLYARIDQTWQRPPHTNSFNRMYYILEGEGRIEVDGKVYYPRTGQLVVMPCQVEQAYSSISDNGFTKYWCHFHSRIGHRDLFELYQFPVCQSVSNPQEVEQSFSLLTASFQNRKPTSPLLVKAAMMELIGHFIDNAATVHSRLPSATVSRMNTVLEYIEQHLHDKITIEEMAQLVHYHPNYFIRAFHSILGCSPIQYINRQRLEKAKELLASDLPIGHIAAQVGIEQHNFSTMFKKHTGFSPRAFRKLMTK